VEFIKEVAARKRATPAQIALAWLLASARRRDPSCDERGAATGSIDQ
jgi:aryl-alcohol dehydrogenase-like predicted oxidoreductase